MAGVVRFFVPFRKFTLLSIAIYVKIILFSMALKDGALIAFSIGLYSTVSISIVFLNRTMFGKTFPFPVFISWFQQFVGCLFLKVLGIIGEQFPSVAVYPNVQVEWSKIKGVSPLTLSFVAMIGLSNTCLKHTPVSAYLSETSQIPNTQLLER